MKNATTTTTPKKNHLPFIVFVVFLFACALLVSSVWDATKALIKITWEFFIFLPSFLIANAGTIIKSDAGKGMIALLIILVILKLTAKEIKQESENQNELPVNTVQATSQPIEEVYSPGREAHRPAINDAEAIRLIFEGKTYSQAFDILYPPLESLKDDLNRKAGFEKWRTRVSKKVNNETDKFSP